VSLFRRDKREKSVFASTHRSPVDRMHKSHRAALDEASFSQAPKTKWWNRG
jgi:hypothetical protein